MEDENEIEECAEVVVENMLREDLEKFIIVF